MAAYAQFGYTYPPASQVSTIIIIFQYYYKYISVKDCLL